MSKAELLNDASYVALFIFITHVLYLKAREVIAEVWVDLCRGVGEMLRLVGEARRFFNEIRSTRDGAASDQARAKLVDATEADDSASAELLGGPGKKPPPG